MQPSSGPENPSSPLMTKTKENSETKEKAPAKIISVYRCIGTTHLDNAEFRTSGKPKCYGIEQKIKTSLDQQSLLRSLLSNKMNTNGSSNEGSQNNNLEEEWTLQTLKQFKEQRTKVLASREYYPDPNTSKNSKNLETNKDSDDFSYTCFGRTNYAVLENMKENRNLEDTKFNESDNNAQFSLDSILTGPPKCTPGFSVKTINKKTQQYSLDLGILRIEMLNDDFDQEVEANASSMDSNTNNKKGNSDQSLDSKPINDISPLSTETKTEREKKREKFLKQREKIYKDFEKERQRFFDKHKSPNHRKLNKEDKNQLFDENSKANYRSIRRRTQRIFAPETPESRHAEHEARRREREEAMDYLLEKSKQQTEEIVKLGNKTFEIMKKITSAVATELKDDFPARVLQSSQRIVGQFGNTMGRCQKTAGMVYRFWMEDDDDDDDFDDEYD